MQDSGPYILQLFPLFYSWLFLFTYLLSPSFPPGLKFFFSLKNLFISLKGRGGESECVRETDNLPSAGTPQMFAMAGDEPRVRSLFLGLTRGCRC